MSKRSLRRIKALIAVVVGEGLAYTGGAEGGLSYCVYAIWDTVGDGIRLSTMGQLRRESASKCAINRVDRKPDSVEDDHLSRMDVAIHLQRPTRISMRITLVA